MNINEAMRNILAVFPNATIDEDNDGQLIVYTNMKIQGDMLLPFEVE